MQFEIVPQDDQVKESTVRLERTDNTGAGTTSDESKNEKDGAIRGKCSTTQLRRQLQIGINQPASCISCYS
jgi:hypothetical protein